MSDKNNSKTNKKSYIFTRETLGMALLLFCALTLFILFTRDWALNTVGVEICRFMYGSFGYGSYIVLGLLAYLGVWLVFEKSVKIKPSVLLSSCACLLVFFLLFHSVTTRDYAMNGYGAYLSDCYNNAASGWAFYTFGGAVSGLIVYPVAKLTTFVGAYVIFSILFLLLAFLVVYTATDGKIIPVIVGLFSRKSVANSEVSVSGATFETERPESAVGNVSEISAVGEDNSAVPVYDAPMNVASPEQKHVEPQQEAPYADNNVDQSSDDSDDRYSRRNLGRKILFENGEFAAESYRRNLIFNEDSYFNHPVANKDDYLKSFEFHPQRNETSESNKSYTESYRDEVIEKPVPEAPSNYIYGEAPVKDFGNEINEAKKPDGSDSVVDVRDSRFGGDYAERSIENEVKAEREIVPPTAYSENTEIRQPEIEQPVERARFTPTPEEHTDSVRFTPEQSERQIDDSARREPVENEPPRQESERSIISSLFGGESVRGERGRVEETGRAEEHGQQEEERSKQNLFDNDEMDLGEDVFGVSSRGGVSDGGRNITDDRTSEEPEKRGDRGFSVDRNERPVSRERGVGFAFSAPDRKDNAELPKEEPKPVEKPKHVWKKYVRPTLDLLDDYPENNNVNAGEIEDNKRIIVEILENFKIESEVTNVTVSPAITRYDVMIADKTKTKTALSYRDDIALALMKKNVNTYLNYLKGAISIEVPNSKRSIVGLKSMLVSPQFINCKPNSLTFGLGKNIDGEVVCPDITKMPHLLVAGTTGSGKSICLSTLLISLLYKYGPEELRLILVDPKQAEFIPYNKLPHLMINEILYDVDKVIKALNWAIKEMERRYTLFKEMTENGVATKTLDEYNSHLPEGEERLPKIVIILDEFADLMMQAKKDIESRIIRLAQKSRACGIHLILATQRPSVDCITGLIKSNLPSRIGFKVNSFADSSTIFDVGGAEKLLGMGDLYYRSVDNPELMRVQGCFVDTHEVQKVTDFVRANNETYFDQDVSEFINKVEEPEVSASMSDEGGDEGGDAKIDDTFIKALKFCVTSNQASVSMIQRRFPVGYIKACKIIDWMENMNYITQSEGSKPRKVLMSKEEFLNTYGDIDD